MASGSCQSSFDPYVLSSDDEQYWILNIVAEITPGWSDCAARSFTAARLYLILSFEAPNNWGQIKPNRNDNHYDPMLIGSPLWIPDIADRWRQPEDTHSKYVDLCNVACNIFSIIPDVVGVGTSFSFGWDIIGCWKLTTTGGTFREDVIFRQFARANNWILAGDDPVLDTTNTENDSQMKEVADEGNWHRMAKVHNSLEMWQGSQNLHAVQNEFCAQIREMTSVRCIPETPGIIKTSWSLFHHDGAAAFKLSERSLLPLALSAKYLPGERTQILNVRWIRRINHHLLENDQDIAP